MKEKLSKTMKASMKAARLSFLELEKEDHWTEKQVKEWWRTYKNLYYSPMKWGLESPRGSKTYREGLYDSLSKV